MPHNGCRPTLKLVVLLSFFALSAATAAPPIAVQADQVPSGILIDRVASLSGLGPAGLEGPVSAARWRQAVDELSRASFVPPGWPALGDIRNSARDAARQGLVPMGFLYVRYERVRDNVPKERASRLSAEDLERAVAFSVAPLVARTHRGARVRFAFDDAWSVTNQQAVRLTFDPGDGSGPRDVQKGTIVEAEYESTGDKRLEARAELDDGRVLTSSSWLQVAALETPTPQDTLHVTGTIPYLGGVASGDAYVYLAAEHATLTDPVLVIEGFDLDDTLGWDELYALLNEENLLETLRSQGFDAVVLDFAVATDYIQRNGLLTVALLQELQNAISPGTNLAVVGASMGGLVGRYALSYMESNAIPHRVRTFISFDSPQKGANIPLGIQYWLDFFADQSAEAAFLLSRLDTPGARQMLVYHHTTTPSSNPGPDALRGQLQSEIAAIGGYPTQPRLVAVANGSGAGADQGFSPGAQIIDYEYQSFFVDITGNVWAVPDGPSTRILEALVDVIFVPPDTMNVVVSGTEPYDSAPGGSRDSMADMDSVEAPSGDIVALHPSHCFIPTVSALDLDTSDLFYDVAGDPDPAAISPFDAVYFPVANQEHVLVTPENATWFLDEIGRARTFAALDAPVTLRFLMSSANPTRGSAVFTLEMPRAGGARVDVFDARGRRVACVLDAFLDAGTHEAAWGGQDDRGIPVASGVYFARAWTQGFGASKQVIVVR